MQIISAHGKRLARQDGFVMIVSLLLLALLTTLFAAYWAVTSLETGSTRYSKTASWGFFSAEAGLNLRADSIRQVFVGYNRPSGTSPTNSSPCSGANQGTLDFRCISYTFNNRSVPTYIVEDPANPMTLTIPVGERYQGLTAQEYRYTAVSSAINSSNTKEAQLELKFKSRLVPLFQFAVFFNKDLEILPGPDMTLSGPIQVNGDMYLYSNSATLAIDGQVTASGDVWRGRKDGSVSPSCNNQPVTVLDPLNPRSLTPNCPSRHKVTQAEIAPWNGMIQIHVPAVTVPSIEVFTPTAGHVYWDRADLRVVATLDASDNITAIQVRNSDDTVDNNATTKINSSATCPGTLSGSKVVGTGTFYNFREGVMVKLLDLDLIKMIDCLKTTSWFGSGKLISDSTDGGLVFHLTLKGPHSGSSSNVYGVRVRNASQIKSTINGAPIVQGLTIVSDQAVYLMGDFNSVSKRPAAILADSINELSNAWTDSHCTSSSNCSISNRVANSTIYNAAFLSGTDTTGGVDGAAGQGAAYSGGLENYPRFHENWSGKVNTYRGSFVSLGKPQHVDGSWGSQSYNPPSRDWNYDTSFNNAANLPPLTPRFVYLRQELFERDFEAN